MSNIQTAGGSFFVFFIGLSLGALAFFLFGLYEGRAPQSPFHCPSCKRRQGFIPVFYFILRQGRCRNCLRGLDALKVFFEVILGVFITFAFFVMGPTLFFLETALFCFMAVLASAVDLKRTILPDTLTLGGLILALLGSFLNPERGWTEAFIGAFFGGGLFLLGGYGYYLIRKIEGIGGGDVKMLAWIGALVGLQGVFYVVMISSLLGVLFSLKTFVLKSDLLKLSEGGFAAQELAFGPYLAFSTYLVLLLEKSNWMKLPLF